MAHDEATFIEAYTRYARRSPRGLKFWLNATGAKADRVEQELRSRGVPIYRSKLVPLDELPRLLITADVHLITLRDPFVGYVLPSKVHACVESGKRILFVGSDMSDVHLLASQAGSDRYARVNVGDVDGLVSALQAMERSLESQSSSVTRGLRAALRSALIRRAQAKGKGLQLRRVADPDLAQCISDRGAAVPLPVPPAVSLIFLRHQANVDIRCSMEVRVRSSVFVKLHGCAE